MNDGANWELEWKTPLAITSASYTALGKTFAEFGEQITITGENLHTVETVMFPGGVTSDFTVSNDYKTITTTVPSETKNGVINLVLFSGASLTTNELSVPTMTIANVSKTKDLKAGDQIVITGEYLNRIVGVSLPGVGEFKDYTVSADGKTMTFTVPEEMTDGKMELIQNGFISATISFMMYSEGGEQTLWAGEFVCSGWGGNQDLAWGGYDWTTVAANTTVKFYYKKNNPGNWGCISLRHGDSWGNLPDPIPGQYDLEEDEGVLTVIFTQDVLTDIIANGGLVITGDNYTLTKITIPSAEVVLWKGSIGPTNWSGDVTIEMTADILSQLEVGKTMGIDFECPADAGYWQIEICGSWWTGLEGPKNVYGRDADGRAIMAFNQGDTNFEWKLVQEDIDILTQQGAMLFVGNGAIINRLYIK